MKAAELKDKSVEELEANLIELMKDQFTYRMQKSTGQLAQTHLLKDVQKDIARVKTVLNQRASQA